VDPVRKKKILESLGIKKRSLLELGKDKEKKDNVDGSSHSVVGHKNQMEDLTQRMWNSMKMNGGYWGVYVNFTNLLF